MSYNSLKTTFCDIVALDSTSKHEEKVARYVVTRLKKLGIKTETDSAGNVIGFWPGEGEPLLLNSHLDRVPLGRGHQPIFKGTVAHSDGTTNLGADDAAGITVILEALETLHTTNQPHRPLVLAFTVQEEIGLFGAQALNLEKFKVSEGVVFDNAFKAGTVVSQGAGYLAFTMTILGKEVHSGKDLNTGVNALNVFLKAPIPSGVFDQGQTRINIGTLHAGQMRNSVPGSLTLLGEIRSFLGEKTIMKHYRSFMKPLEAAANRAGAKLETTTFALPSYAVNEEESLLKKYQAILATQNLKLKLQPTFIGSDANALRGIKGLKVFVISTGVKNEHSVEETVDLRDLEKLQSDLLDLVKA